MSSDSNKKYKKPKHEVGGTTNPGPSRPRTRPRESSDRQPACPLLAKDSEWADIVQSASTNTNKTPSNHSHEEEVLQLVECEDGPQMKPLAVMFPGILDKDPLTLQGMLNRAMSTTEVTKHLVDLGQKANFTFMKKADRLIPPDKKWMESLTENSNSICSVTSGPCSFQTCISSDYEADSEIKEISKQNKVKKKKKHILTKSLNESSSEVFKEKDRRKESK